jgi:phosphoglycerate dehydrogenase-like enzyme
MPHVGASTPFSWMSAQNFVREQTERYLAGQPLANVITGEY